MVIMRKVSKYRLGVNEDDENQGRNNVEKQIDFIFLIISTVFLMVYCLLLTTGCIISLVYNRPVASIQLKYLKLIDSVLPLIQSFLQVLIIWILGSKITLHKGFLQIFILLNFALWLFETFSASKHETSKVQSDVYGQSAWEILASIFIPLSIFFRFHSSVILVKINAKKYSSNAGSH